MLPVSSTIATVLVALFPPPKPVVEPVVTATYLGIEGRQDFAFVAKPLGDFRRAAGRLNWNVPPSTLGTMGLDRNFTTFCAEPIATVAAGTTYGFAVDPLDKPAVYGLPETDAGRETAKKKAKFLRELFGRYHADTQPDSKAGPDAPAAFQVAVWEVLNEQELPDGPMPLNLFTGSFLANYPREADAPPFVQLAQQYVTSLTGNDAPFFENPNFAGLELVRLTGLVGANGAVAQSQLAARVKSGASDTAGGAGTPGSETPLALGTGPGFIGPVRGGIGSPLGGVPGGGVPGGGASGFPIVASPVGSTTTTTTPTGSSSSPSGTDTSTGSSSPTSPTLPVETPPGGGSSGGSSSGNTPGSTQFSGGETGTTPDTVPVPAPGGLILGGLAAAALLARRQWGRSAA